MVRKFLIVELNPEGQFLLSATLKRKFPEAVVRLCERAEPALAAARGEVFDAIVVHRTGEAEGLPLVRQLRQLAPHAVIALVSGRDQSAQAREAGATLFLNFDEWLRLGTVLEAELAHPRA